MLDKQLEFEIMSVGFFMGTSYSAVTIARYFIYLNNKDKNSGVKERKPLTHLKLQKLLYYAQGWFLAQFNLPLFDESIEAWDYGPVVKSVYSIFREFGSKEIDCEIDDNEISKLQKEVKDFLDEIWTQFKPYTGLDLVHSTHSEKPWSFTYYSSKTIIDKSIIYDFFRKLNLKRNGSET